MWKASHMKAKMWWEANRQWSGAIIPVRETDVCMAVLDNYQVVEVQLCTVVQSSSIGNKLFGLAHRQYQGSLLSNLVKTTVAKLVMIDVTPATVQKSRQDFIAAATASGRDVKEALPKRVVEIFYRGAVVPIVVHSHFDEYCMYEAAVLESIAVDTGILQPLFCENSLVPANRGISGIKINASLVAGAASARRAASAAIVADSPSGEVILNSMNSNMAQFIQLDRGWRVTVAFWSSVVGQGAEKRLQAEVLMCLSDKHNHITVHQAIENMDELGRSKLVAFCGLGLQSLFNSVKTFLQDIKCSRPPKYDGQNDSTFLQQIMHVVANFLVFIPPGSSASAQALRGHAAAQAKLGVLRAQKASGEKIPLTVISELRLFGWVLTTAELAEVAIMTDEAIKNDVVSAAAASSSNRAEGKSKAGRKKLAPNARDAVLNLLA
jgi:hypothetical protein